MESEGFCASNDFRLFVIPQLEVNAGDQIVGIGLGVQIDDAIIGILPALATRCGVVRFLVLYHIDYGNLLMDGHIGFLPSQIRLYYEKVASI